MTPTPRLDAYHFYEAEWENHEQLRETFEWEVPETFNIAAYICDRWVGDGVAVHAETAEGGTRTVTFETLEERSNRLATHLRRQGVERGDRVGVNVPQRPETLVAHIACWKLGAMSVPLSTLFGPDALRYRLDDCNGVACVVDERNVAALREVGDDLDALAEVVVVGGVDSAGTLQSAETQDDETAYRDVVRNTPAAVETVATDPDEDAVLIYTSGTTGDPKGVRHGHRVLLGHLPCFVTSFCNNELPEDATFWTPSEWAWIGALFDVIAPALFYGRPVVAYDGGKFDPGTAYRLLAEYDVTNYFAPPTALRMMMRADPPADVSSVRVVASGGESLGESLTAWAVDVFDGAAVHEIYGQTEANLLVGDCQALVETPESLIGPQAPGHEVAILDPETAEPAVERGEVGEIAVRYEGNPVCLKEYWGKPEQTDRKVQDGWVLTEDLGWMDEDGFVGFQSRKDDVIISAGYRIGPEEVEEHIATHDAVADAAVIGIPDEERGEVPKAFVVPVGADPNPALAEAIQDHVRDRLAKYEYPREVEFIDELPTTSTGKVRRASLREREGLA